MNNGLPDHIPPRPRRIPRRVPPRGCEEPLPPHLHQTTKVPRVFSIWGTILYGIAAIASITTILVMDFTRWTPTTVVHPAAFPIHVHRHLGIIALGRIECNRDMLFFIRASASGAKRTSARCER